MNHPIPCTYDLEEEVTQISLRQTTQAQKFLGMLVNGVILRMECRQELFVHVTEIQCCLCEFLYSHPLNSAMHLILHDKALNIFEVCG